MQGMINYSDHIDELIAKQVADMLTPEERNQLEEWISLSDVNKKYADEMKKVWELADEIPTWHASAEETEMAWHAVQEKTIAKPNVVPMYRWISAAASIVLLVSIWWFWPRTVQPEIQSATAGHATQTLELSDGSEVVLTAHSTLYYPAVFDAKVRRVKLEGEAHFTVKGNAAQPFKISVAGSIIEVVGTQFLVGQKQDSVYVSVNEGVVKLFDEKNEALKSISISAGEAAYRIDGNAPVKMEHISAKLLTKDWLFEATNVADVLTIWEQTYQVEFQVENPVFLNCKLSAKFTQANLTDVLETLQMVFDIEISVSGDRISIKGKGC